MTANQPTGPMGAEPANQTADWKALRGDVEGIADVAAERGRSFVESARSHATDYIDQRKGVISVSISISVAADSSLAGRSSRANL